MIIDVPHCRLRSRSARLPRTRTSCSSCRARRPPTSPGRSATPAPFTGPTTPGCGERHRHGDGRLGDTWFFLTADYAFGSSARTHTPRSSGTVQGARQCPASAQHVGLLVAAAGAVVEGQVIGLANAGGDTINSIKQAAEFGIVKGGRSSRACWCSRATQRARIADRPFADRELVDGNDRPRLDQALQVERNAAEVPDDDPRRRWRIPHYLKARVALGGNPEGRT